jgi:hypothetical protein
MITNPSFLCSRVLSACYLKGGDVLTTSAPKSGSFTWKSILHGRDLLKEGLVWRIGNGQKIKVWEDNWIPRSGLMRPLGAKPNTAPVSMASDLLLVDGQGWNVAKVNELFFEGDVEDILKIRVG